MKSSAARKYTQDARALSAAATGERILDSFIALLKTRWLEEIRLEEVARDAGVTVQTVIRRFGGKEGLLEASARRLGDQIRLVRETPPGAVAQGVEALVSDYEQSGDVVLRLLFQEPRHAALKPLLDRGRAAHRAWLEALLAPWLDGLSPQEREDRLAAIIVVTDVYAWGLLRRDQGRGREETRRIILQAVERIIDKGAQ